MANSLYTKLRSTVSDYIGDEKADAVIGRQLERCKATPDDLTVTNIEEVMNFLVGATTLYLHGDNAKQDELVAKLEAFV